MSLIELKAKLDTAQEKKNDRGAWWATVYRVTRGWTQLSD